ncbi:Scorpion long chain toxin/defensin [Arabidopsis suecica]|uniref:Scorpion long chain toxin/defensin n=1 Tax=Arabidopsis suecica TaxID=45249 RepID=A0A8T2G891_ARASU|nr:Scorpion long chain toxin/defensin [Arabidopsis suecica]CAG15173.1 putative trypsin inhibitor 4 [Arabidopsis thaliana]CAG15178.1 putative trypsin inhibitor 4 [Arabidopsis thaliana]CAG15184.1 putative trypsin inhibitor 4 [Arabidopsis thaliana]CAG15190.1 putative trypsin inhibitor 4 [Arabidopsis thaliana]
MATKSVLSIFAIFTILVLVIFEIPEIEAHDSECLKEYGGDVGFGFCAPKIFPTICYRNCQKDKGANGGKCLWGEGGNVKCLCDFCSKESFNQFISLT